MPLNDKQIRGYVDRQQMISPFKATSVSEHYQGKKLPSYGLSSYGYDIRIENQIKMLKPQGISGNRPLSPIDNNDDDYVTFDVIDDRFIIPPHGFILAYTKEYFKIPRNVLAVCMGKSTYARLGLIVNVTPLEPEWQGHVVIEISNTTDRGIEIFTKGGIAQFVFLHNYEACEVSYSDRQGKYQHQKGITTAR